MWVFRRYKSQVLILCLWLGWGNVVGFMASPTLWAVDSDPNERFKNYEVRVIRPKFFQKRQRMELGAQFNVIMNDSYVYTLLASGVLGYHFTEAIGAELNASIGQSIDRKEKEILFNDYNIKTDVFRTLYALEGALLYTPIYGKIQLSNVRLVYFDTFFSFGGGMTGVEWRYDDMCQDHTDVNPNRAPPPPNTTKSYPNFLVGIGQRIFRNQKTSFRWDLRTHGVLYNRADASCDPENASSSSSLKTNITLQIGASQYF